MAAFYPLAFAAEQVGAGAVVNLTRAGAEPHDLELSAADIVAVREARVVLYLGRGFQPALADALAERDGPSLDLLAGQEPIAPVAGGDPVDPHVWLDPVRFGAMARGVASELGPPASADALVARLERLDADFERGLATCARREIVTSHAAFAYLADRYGLEQVAFAGVAPEAEPSPRDLEALVDEVRERGATTVFFETLVSPELAETVAREAGAATAVLDPLEGLSQDRHDDGADYVSVMRENLAALRRALGCT